jgi:hypothetical protein
MNIHRLHRFHREVGTIRVSGWIQLELLVERLTHLLTQVVLTSSLSV